MKKRHFQPLLVLYSDSPGGAAIAGLSCEQIASLVESEMETSYVRIFDPATRPDPTRSLSVLKQLILGQPLAS